MKTAIVYLIETYRLIGVGGRTDTHRRRGRKIETERERQRQRKKKRIDGRADGGTDGADVQTGRQTER
jgi:hypothetical protein